MIILLLVFTIFVCVYTSFIVFAKLARGQCILWIWIALWALSVTAIITHFMGIW